MLMMFYWGLPCFLFLIGIFMFVSNWKHLLSMLLSLEYIVLNLFFLLFIYLNLMDFSSFFSMMFLTFSVCEGALNSMHLNEKLFICMLLIQLFSE